MIQEIVPNYCETFRLKTKLHINAFVASFLDGGKLERILEIKIVCSLDLIDYVQTFVLCNVKLIDKFIGTLRTPVDSLLPQTQRYARFRRTNCSLLLRCSERCQFIEVFGVEKIACLLGDRECIGEKWFAYLHLHNIKFCIRIQMNMNLSRTNGRLSPASNFFRSLPIGTSCSLIGTRLVCGHQLWVTGGRLPSGEYLIIVSSYLAGEVMDD